MAKMKTATLVSKMRENPAAVREFLDSLSDKRLAELFPDHNISVKMITITNMMSGLPVVIPANTPHFLRVDSESYWSS
jgi:hypothetical protein